MSIWPEKAENFDLLVHGLQSRVGTYEGAYFAPEVLAGGIRASTLVNVGDPYVFYLEHLERIAARSSTVEHRDRTAIKASDVIYQAYMRTFSAVNGEIGTCLKQIAFLPILQDKLGITIFLTLPVSTIGTANRKGVRGSPFAVTDPFAIDASLADPLLPDLSALVQYKALIEACRLLGIRSGSIVPLATLAIDARLIREYPDLVFWWGAEPGEKLTPQDLGALSFADRGDLKTQRNQSIYERFVYAPAPASVREYIRGDEHFYTASVPEEQERLITVANAVPDIVVGDAATYTWKDVAAVNYSGRLFPAQMGSLPTEQIDRTRSAWEVMPRLLAWRAQTLGEEVFLVDVSGSVPEEVLLRGRDQANNAFCEYSFRPEDTADGSLLSDNGRSDQATFPRETLNSGPDNRIRFIAEELFTLDASNHTVDAVVGPFIFSVSAHTRNLQVLVSSLRRHLELLEHRQAQNLYFVGAGNHDTMPPKPGYAPLLYAFYYFLPSSLPMIFSGTEFHAQEITNKEFGFDTSPELLRLRQTLADEDLGLFNDQPINWTMLPSHDVVGRPLINMFDLIPHLNRLKHWYGRTVPSSHYHFLPCGDEWGGQAGASEDFFGYARMRVGTSHDGLTVLANWSEQQSVAIRWPNTPAVIILSLGLDEYPPQVQFCDIVRLPPLSLVVLLTGTLRSGAWQPGCYL